MKNNLLIKVLVILIAVLLWVQQILLRTHTVVLDVPIQLLNIPADLAIEQIELPKIPVKVRGKGLDIISANISNVTIDVDASNYLYGKNRIRFAVKNITYSDRIQLFIVEIQDDSNLQVSMDKLVEKKKPISIQYASAKDEEFFIVNKIINSQQRVTLKGPLAVISEIKSIKTQKITKKMVVENKVSVSLITPHENIQLLKDVIVLEVTQTKIVNKTISLIPIKFPESENITIIPQKVSVMVRGPEELVEKLDNSTIIANLELGKIRKNFTDVSFELPSGIKIVEFTPKKIQVIRNE
jgi:YbbR-like protein